MLSLPTTHNNIKFRSMAHGHDFHSALPPDKDHFRRQLLRLKGAFAECVQRYASTVGFPTVQAAEYLTPFMLHWTTSGLGALCLPHQQPVPGDQHWCRQRLRNNTLTFYFFFSRLRSRGSLMSRATAWWPDRDTHKHTYTHIYRITHILIVCPSYVQAHLSRLRKYRLAAFDYV